MRVSFELGEKASARIHTHVFTYSPFLFMLQRADYVKKLQGIAAHEKKMQHRSFAAINERLAKLGLSIKSKKAEREGTTAVV